MAIHMNPLDRSTVLMGEAPAGMGFMGDDSMMGGVVAVVGGAGVMRVGHVIGCVDCKS